MSCLVLSACTALALALAFQALRLPPILSTFLMSVGKQGVKDTTVCLIPVTAGLVWVARANKTIDYYGDERCSIVEQGSTFD
jgi:hypothetical protein